MSNTVTVVVPLVGGLDTKTDPKVVLPGNLTILENGDFTKGKSVRWRKGYVKVPAAKVDNTDVTDAISAAALGDGYVLLGRQYAYALDRAKNAWSPLGPYTPVHLRQDDIAFGSTAQTHADMDTSNGVTVVAWEDSRGGVWASIHDEASGATLIPEFAVASSDAQQPRVVATGANIVITWFKPSTDAILCRVIKTTDVDGSYASTNITLAADVHSDGQYDATAGDGVFYLAFRQDPAVNDYVRVFRVNPLGTVIDADEIPLAPGSGPVLAWNAVGDGLFVAFVDDATTNALIYKLDGSDLSTLASTTATSSTGNVALAVCALPDGGASVWAQTTPGGDSEAVITITTHNEDLDTKANVGDLRHAELASTGFNDAFNGYFIVRYNDSDLTDLQNSFFLYRHDAVLIGRAMPGEADSDTDWLPRVKSIGDDLFQVALGFKRQVGVNLDKITGVGKQTPVFEHPGIKRCTIDTAPEVSAVEVDHVLYTSGGLMWSIDGYGPPVEAQFQLFPDQIAASLTPVTAGGDMSDNVTYGYRVYAEWPNGRGQRVRSLALTLSIGMGGSNDTVEVLIQTLSHTRMESRSPVSLVVYRTLANRTDFYHRVSSSDPTAAGANGYVANDTTADTVLFNDQMSDTDAEQQEIDYASHGETEHFAFDAPAVVAAVGNRVFCGGGGQFPDRPQFGLLRRDGRPVETNDTWVVSEFPEFGGNLTGFADTNGVPIVFKERAIYGVEGNGPTNQRGAVSDYQAKAVTTDVGCTEPRSIVQIPDGVMFKSAKGIYLLDQGLNLTYVGASVERYNSQRITGAAVVPNTNMVLFTTDDGVALMYDYFYNAWGTYLNHEGVAMATAGDSLAYLRNDGELYVRDEDVYTDAGITYSLRFRTAPLHLEDTVQGFDKLRTAQVLGEYLSDHTLDVSLYYNRDRSPYQTLTFVPGDVLDLDIWGEEVPWGGDTIWGGDWMAEDYDFELKPKRSKFSTVAFEFTGHPGVTPGACFELTELLLECKTRGGPMRLPARRKL